MRWHSRRSDRRGYDGVRVGRSLVATQGAEFIGIYEQKALDKT